MNIYNYNIYNFNNSSLNIRGEKGGGKSSKYLKELVITVLVLFLLFGYFIIPQPVYDFILSTIYNLSKIGWS